MPVLDGLNVADHILAEYGADRPKLVAVSASVLAHEQQEYSTPVSMISSPNRNGLS